MKRFDQLPQGQSLNFKMNLSKHQKILIIMLVIFLIATCFLFAIMSNQLGNLIIKFQQLKDSMQTRNKLVNNYQKKLDQTIELINKKVKNSQQNKRITYIWLGNKQIPPEYVKTVQKNNGILFGNKEYQYYIQKWNQSEQPKIVGEYHFIQQFDMLKLLSLYFEGNCYSDFDTAINRTCFQQITPPQNQILFTNTNYNKNRLAVPEENFMCVQFKYNQMVKRMLILQIKKQYRWAECQKRQCYIINCQNHRGDGSYSK